MFHFYNPERGYRNETTRLKSVKLSYWINDIGPYINDVHKGGAWGSFEIFHVIPDCIVFKW